MSRPPAQTREPVGPEATSESTDTVLDPASTPAATEDVGGPAASTPSYRFLGVVAALVLVLDAATKWWAETTLSQRTLESPSIVLIEDVLTFSLAYNKGGAFGMLADENAAWREPFFLLVSIGAVAFIVSLYRKLEERQRALRWGLPLVLGGALGNFADRLAKGKVVDFIDYRAGWVEMMNELIAKVNSSWYVTDHWPTFNVADMAICVGIGLMALDMFTSRRDPEASADTAEDATERPEAKGAMTSS